MTVNELIRKSLLLAGVLSARARANQTKADGLGSLNDLLDSWSTDGFINPSKHHRRVYLTLRSRLTTIGAGNFNTANPASDWI